MYNRYIPQSDGSHRRSRMPEPESPRPRPVPQPCPPPEAPCPPPPPPECRRCQQRPQPRRTGDSAAGFLKGLLPQGLDTEDLLIVLLLLLMSGQDREDRNLPLLTLALYLFL